MTTIEKEFAGQDLKINEARTNFSFETLAINVLFIIDADIDSELRFSQFLTQSKKSIYESDKYFSDIFYINKRDAKIDVDAINHDYPFTRTDKK